MRNLTTVSLVLCLVFAGGCAAEAMKHAVFASPGNQAAKDLLADAYEQLGYQAESGPWRSVYLQGAFELRKPNATPDVPLTMTKGTIDAIQLKTIGFDEAVQKGDIAVDGNIESFREFMGLLDNFEFWFNIVTP